MTSADHKNIEDQDLDSYLDNVLDEFETTKVDAPVEVKKEIEATTDDEEFMKLLQQNMAKMLSEESNSTPKVDDKENKKEFQSTISETLQKLKNSSSQAEAQTENVDNDAMESMMKELEGLMDSGE